MTLQEAKDQVAQKKGWKDWNSYVFNYRVGLGSTFEQSMDEAAELYARSKWDEAIALRDNQVEMGFGVSVSVLEKPEFKP